MCERIGSARPSRRAEGHAEALHQLHPLARRGTRGGVRGPDETRCIPRGREGARDARDQRLRARRGRVRRGGHDGVDRRHVPRLFPHAPDRAQGARHAEVAARRGQRLEGRPRPGKRRRPASRRAAQVGRAALRGGEACSLNARS